ncbi:MAG: type I DNA topoisomerase [Planctomycetes bacterium]|nr:type I DNA topoisomerase [Planctomycetota bacterium]
MGRSLVIVESPAKAKTINKYLGKDFVVKSSYGHIRDLPSGQGEEDEDEKAERAKTAAKAKKAAAKMSETQKIVAKAARSQLALVRRMGVDPEHGWAARYEVLPGKEKVLKELKEYAEDADTIYLATDRDREGEAIAWHLREVIGGDPKRFKRVTFSEITKTAIQEAFQKSGTLDMNGVNAQQARRFLDRVVGFMVSPLLWAKVARGLSAGRVQSVAVRLIAEREAEIRKFIPDEYWEVFADLATPAAIRAQVMRFTGEPYKPTTKDHADAAVNALTKATFTVAAKEDKAARSFPNAPFITSTLQQAASVRLGFSVKKTMTLAQRLYEAGHITYMRTDSVNLSAEAVATCRTLIGKKFGERYLPAQAITYKSKSGAQEAHEAIRPTDVRNDEIAGIDNDEARLYDLIWRQFVACQMPPAEFDTTTITIAAANYELIARGRVLRFDGYQKVQPPAKQDDVELPTVQVGQVLTLVELDPSQHFTKPPARFSEAALVKELEKRGIGRPSTYAAIISTIQERGYVRLNNRRFYAEKLGDIVTERLVESFPDLLDYGFTAGMEEDLDEIAEAKSTWKNVLDEFYKGFKTKLESASKSMRTNPPVPVDLTCPKCNKHKLAIRTAKTGVFLSCTGYALDKKDPEHCAHTVNLVSGDESEAVTNKNEDPDATEASEAETRIFIKKRRCPICKTAMDSWLVDETRRLHICGRNPDCTGSMVETGHFKLKGYDGPVIECDKCGKPMQLKSGRFGKYFGCTGYPDCKNTRKLLRSGQAAPPKCDPIPMPELICSDGKAHYILRDGMLGLFLAASTYPRLRETRPPKVQDLQRHRAQLNEKFLYLADGPVVDPKGNPALVRFSRKTREHYLASEKDGEPSGWSAFFVEGKWIEKAPEPEDKPARGAKKAKK